MTPESTEDRDELVLANLGLARAIARSLKQHLPASIDLDDLTAEGYLGLLQAATRYDPGEECSFATYARYVIRGAILDSVRRRNGRGRADPEGLEGIAHPAILPVIDAEIFAEQQGARLRAAVIELPAREREVVELRYTGEKTMLEIGRAMGFNESRASQVHSAAVARLRAQLAA